MAMRMPDNRHLTASSPSSFGGSGSYSNPAEGRRSVSFGPAQVQQFDKDESLSGDWHLHQRQQQHLHEQQQQQQQQRQQMAFTVPEPPPRKR